MELGVEHFLRAPKLASQWGRCALLCNQASVLPNFTPTWKALQDVLGARLVALFGPQHGFAGTAQDNMIETGHMRHVASGLPVYSLYSETREPTPEMLKDVDTILIDLQTVGCRVYTFKYTIAGCLRMAKKLGKRVVIFDRPNPVGGKYVEGNVLDADCTSFVGQYQIPMRHGLTAGEAARFFNLDVGAELEVIAMEGWSADMYWSDTKIPWVLTSPNLPTIDPVYVYPGMVMVEGTNFSEGRGTGLPFQLIGAPYIKSPEALVARVLEIAGTAARGVFLRPASFEPTSQKWQKTLCNGFQIHVQDFRNLPSYYLALAVVRAFYELGGKSFAWKEPPYEYDYSTLPMILILGSKNAATELTGSSFDVKSPFWQKGLKEYCAKAAPVLIYPRELKPLVP